jgi:hypothetical protein
VSLQISLAFKIKVDLEFEITFKQNPALSQAAILVFSCYLHLLSELGYKRVS